MKKVLSIILAAVLTAGFSLAAFGADSVKYGDVTGNGVINSDDALQILNYSVGTATLSKEQMKLADVSADNVINSYDALLILKFSVELISSFPAEGGTAPSEMTVEEIVKLYNDAANKTKAYTGNFKIDCKDGVKTEIVDTSFPNAAAKIAAGLLPNDYPSNTTATVKNGSGKGTKTKPDGSTTAINESLKDYLVIHGDEKMSKLTASGVKSASCEKVKEGYKVTITLKPEQVKSLSAKPVNHGACMEILDITEDDLKPFTLEECTINYLGGTITAVINESNGMLASYDAVEPMNLTGTLKWTAIKGTATLDASYHGTYTFTY
ncbi:MAG: dockerin type I repeat-containing protein [Clostridia bacterium]|nr:dockerin type I repeat-containing protein [Clostridia bacterium]